MSGAEPKRPRAPWVGVDQGYAKLADPLRGRQ